MPIPRPRDDEEEQDFIDRCMSDETMVEEYPDGRQRAAVCYRTWRDHLREQRRAKSDAAREGGDDVEGARWTRAYINDLPDDAFLYVEPGGEKDEEGKTVPRYLRHFPYKNHRGEVDFPHLRNAISRIPQSDLPESVKRRLMEKARRILDEIKRRGASSRAGGMVYFACESVEIRAAQGRQRLPRLHVVAYTGGVMQIDGWTSPVVVDLAGLEVPAKVPILADHSPTERVGHGVPYVDDEGRLVVDGVVSVRTSRAARELLQSAPEGFPWGASIGAQAIETVYRREGEVVEVNGRAIRVTADGLVEIKRARLREVSVVPVAADVSTYVDVAASGAQRQQKENEMGEQKQKQSEERQREQMEAQATVDLEVVRREAAEAERRRVADIRAAAKGFDGVDDLVDEAVEKGFSVDEFRAALLDRVRSQRPRAPEMMERDRTVDRKVLEAALVLRAGVGSSEFLRRHYGEETLNRAYDVRREVDLRRAAEICASWSGVNLTGDVGSREWIRAAFSTTDLSGILGAVANKALQAAFEAAEATVPRIARKVSHSNFQTHTVYSLAVSGEMEEVGPDGELKLLELGEESRTRRVTTRGAVLRITRQDLVNDDVGAFAENGARLGRKAVMAREKALYELVNGTGAGSSFFTSARGNYITDALDLDGLKAAVEKFRLIEGPDGHPILAAPRYLLVPPALEQTAKELTKSDRLIAVGVGGSAKRAPAFNPFAGLFEPVVSPYLQDDSISGSATAWYLIADPADVPCFEVAYLNGQDTPTVEFYGVETEPNVLGVTWRCYWDFGCALAEWRGGVKSAGTG